MAKDQMLRHLEGGINVFTKFLFFCGCQNISVKTANENSI